MNRFTKFSLSVSVFLVAALFIGWFQNVPVYKEIGGARLVIGSGGSLDVASGGEIDVESGGALKLAGTAVTATAGELNLLASTSIGVATASKVLVAGATKNLDTLVIDDLFTLTPTDAEPAGAEGNIYWDDSENALKVYNGASWSALSAGSGDNTLDIAYDQGGAGAGRTIVADTGAVVITNTDSDGAFLLSVTPTPGGAAATGGIVITSGANSTEDSLQINNSGSGDDIQGTGSTWSVTKAGVLTAVDAQLTTATVSSTFTASNGVSLANGGTLTNDTNNEIEFTENSEEFSFAFTSNTITLATDTAIDTFDLGVVDDLAGVGTIAFDAEASIIGLAANGAGDDLTVRVTGAQNASLILSSSGTAVDAMQLTTTAGGIDILNGGAAAEDLDITATNASVIITAGEAQPNAISLQSTLGGLDIDVADSTAAAVSIQASAGGLDVDVVDDLILTVASSGAADDLVLEQTGAFNASISLQAAGTGTDAINIDATAGGVDIDAVDDINITCASSAGADDFNIIQTGAVDASISLQAAGTGADAISLQASAGGIDIDAVDDINITCASSAGADDLNIIQTGAFNASISLQAAGTGADAISLQASAGGIDINALDDLNISVASTAGSDDLVIEQTGAQDASILLQAAGTGTDAIGLVASAGGITLSASNGDINVLHDLDVDGAIVGDGLAAITGMLYTVTDDVNGKTVGIDEAGSVQTNSGAGGPFIWNLPEASTAIGMSFTFVTIAVQNLDINPDDADQILVLTNAAGDAIRNATAGNTITLVAVDATNWAVIAEKGTWTDVD